MSKRKAAKRTIAFCAAIMVLASSMAADFAPFIEPIVTVSAEATDTGSTEGTSGETDTSSNVTVTLNEAATYEYSVKIQKTEVKVGDAVTSTTYAYSLTDSGALASYFDINLSDTELTISRKSETDSSYSAMIFDESAKLEEDVSKLTYTTDTSSDSSSASEDGSTTTVTTTSSYATVSFTPTLRNYTVKDSNDNELTVKDSSDNEVKAHYGDKVDVKVSAGRNYTYTSGVAAGSSNSSTGKGNITIAGDTVITLGYISYSVSGITDSAGNQIVNCDKTTATIADKLTFKVADNYKVSEITVNDSSVDLSSGEGTYKMSENDAEIGIVAVSADSSAISYKVTHGDNITLTDENGNEVTGDYYTTGTVTGKVTLSSYPGQKVTLKANETEVQGYNSSTGEFTLENVSAPVTLTVISEKISFSPKTYTVDGSETTVCTVKEMSRTVKNGETIARVKVTPEDSYVIYGAEFSSGKVVSSEGNSGDGSYTYDVDVSNCHDDITVSTDDWAEMVVCTAEFKDGDSSDEADLSDDNKKESSAKITFYINDKEVTRLSKKDEFVAKATVKEGSQWHINSFSYSNDSNQSGSDTTSTLGENDSESASLTVSNLKSDTTFTAVVALDKFAVEANCNEGGDASINGASISWGNTSTIIATPNEGYYVESITITGTDKDGNDITGYDVKDGLDDTEKDCLVTSDGKYTGEVKISANIGSNITYTVVFKKASESAISVTTASTGSGSQLGCESFKTGTDKKLWLKSGTEPEFTLKPVNTNEKDNYVKFEGNTAYTNSEDTKTKTVSTTNNTISAYVLDTTTGIVTKETYTLNVDGTAPKFTTDPSVDYGTEWTNEKANVNFSVEDDDSGLKEYSYSYELGDSETGSGELLSVGEPNCKFTLSSDMDGDVAVTVTDNVGYSTTKSVTVKIDTKSPQIDSVTPVVKSGNGYVEFTKNALEYKWANSTVTCLVKASDEKVNGVASGVANVQYSTDGDNWEDLTVKKYSVDENGTYTEDDENGEEYYTCDLPENFNGNVQFKAIDNATNESDPKKIHTLTK